MFRNLLAGASVAALTTGAFAADLPLIDPVPVFQPVAPIVSLYNWTGFYAGVHGGYAFNSDGSGVLVFDTNRDGVFNDTVRTGTGADAFSPGFTSRFRGGVDVGARIGYDWQFGSMLVGAVADLSYVNISDRTTGFSTTPAFYTFARDIDWLGTARLRAGFAADRFLIYATGGLAYANVEHRFTTDTPAATISPASREERKLGYTIGGGVEGKVTDRVSVGLEYLYTDLGRDNFTVRLAGPGAPGGPFGAGTDIRRTDRRFDFHTVRVGVNFRFGGGM